MSVPTEEEALSRLVLRIKGQSSDAGVQILREYKQWLLCAADESLVGCICHCHVGTIANADQPVHETCVACQVEMADIGKESRSNLYEALGDARPVLAEAHAQGFACQHCQRDDPDGTPSCALLGRIDGTLMAEDGVATGSLVRDELADALLNVGLRFHVDGKIRKSGVHFQHSGNFDECDEMFCSEARKALAKVPR